MYTVYKITNTLNNKIYVGVHKTNDPHDSYMGSGKAIKQAILKHGKGNFIKEVLCITEDKQTAYDLEKELTVNFESNKTYNMRLGGIGGFTRENALKGHIARSKKGGNTAKELKAGFHSFSKEELSEAGRKGGLKLKGKPKTEAWRQAVREAWLRKKNKPL